MWLGLLHTINYCYSTNIEPSHRNTKSKLAKSSYNDTLVNLHNFQYVMNNASLCMQSTSPTETIVIMIHSSRSNFDERYAIRSTWGSIKSYKQWHFRLIFLLGIDAVSDPLSYIETRLKDESKQHGDLIMGNFVDSYRNLTYKHLMG